MELFATITTVNADGAPTTTSHVVPGYPDRTGPDALMSDRAASLLRDLAQFDRAPRVTIDLEWQTVVYRIAEEWQTVFYPGGQET